MTGGYSLGLWFVDAGLTYYINSFSGQLWALDDLMRLTSLAGVPLMVLAVAVLWWTRSSRFQTRHALIVAGLSFLTALLLNQIVLLFVQRVRPYEAGVTHLLLQPSADPSFPSDHATAAFAIAFTFLSYRLKHRWAFVSAATLVAISRVYLGTHYVSDILGGMVTALIAVAAVHAAFRSESWLSQKLVHFL